METRTGVPCLGVFPFAGDIQLDDEDSLSVPATAPKTPMPEGRRCAIVRLPRISNTTDFRLLQDARWIFAPVDECFDFIFLPGTKDTAGDLRWLREQKLDEWIGAQHRGGATIVGICGGFQMLGEAITDPYGMESNCVETTGLGLLPVRTTMRPEKTTEVVRASTPRGHHVFGLRDPSGRDHNCPVRFRAIRRTRRRYGRGHPPRSCRRHLPSRSLRGPVGSGRTGNCRLFVRRPTLRSPRRLV